MAVDESFVEALVRLGLAEYEARIYTTLAKMGSCKAPEISFFSKVPRTKTYGVLKELERKGFVTSIPDKPERYAAVSPGEVLAPLVDRMNKEVSKCVELVQNLEVSYESSKYLRRTEYYEKGVLWTVRGRDKVYERINELIRGSQKTIKMMTTANGLVRAYKSLSETMEKAIKRNVEVRLLASTTQENMSVVRELKEIVHIKNFVGVPQAQYVSFDSKEVLASEAIPDDLNTSQGMDLAFATQNQLIVQMYDSLFDYIWQKS